MCTPQLTTHSTNISLSLRRHGSFTVALLRLFGRQLHLFQLHCNVSLLQILFSLLCLLRYSISRLRMGCLHLEQGFFAI